METGKRHHHATAAEWIPLVELSKKFRDENYAAEAHDV
jgi:hypothetical protein